MYLEDAHEAERHYKSCFKKIYRENQVEMINERKEELKLVKQLAEENLKAPNGKIRKK